MHPISKSKSEKNTIAPSYSIKHFIILETKPKKLLDRLKIKVLYTWEIILLYFINATSTKVCIPTHAFLVVKPY